MARLQQKTQAAVTTGLAGSTGGLNGVTAYTCSLRCAGLDSHRHSQIIIRELDPSIGGPGPHDFAVRISRARLAQRTRPSHPAPNVRDDRETPLLWERDARSNTRFPIFVNRNFRAGEPEGPDQLEATREFSFFAQAILVA
jgi:hypothetical protein